MGEKAFLDVVVILGHGRGREGGVVVVMEEWVEESGKSRKVSTGNVCREKLFTPGPAVLIAAMVQAKIKLEEEEEEITAPSSSNPSSPARFSVAERSGFEFQNFQTPSLPDLKERQETK